MTAQPTSVLYTARLQLRALSAAQLQQYLEALPALEQALGLRLSRAVLTPRVQRALQMKIARMAAAPAADHLWYTYWLISLPAEGFGAGLAGFKGVPDERGEIEIGYGIDPQVQGRGCMTEAVRALAGWAFQDARCQAILAPDTRRDNPASNRVLAKAGFRIYHETEAAVSWRLTRPPESTHP